MSGKGKTKSGAKKGEDKEEIQIVSRNRRGGGMKTRSWIDWNAGS